MKQTGYKMKEYGIPTKRYCQTLDLKDDPELISEYRKCRRKRNLVILPPILPCSQPAA